MNTKQKPELRFYQKLGELFYAIAASDKVIRDAEVKTLRELVHEKWKQVDTLEDEYHTDASYQIEIVFDWMEDSQLDAQTCFNDFKTFKEEHPSLFTSKINSIILETAHAIANSFAGKNKAELVMLAKLDLLLKS